MDCLPTVPPAKPRGGFLYFLLWKITIKKKKSDQDTVLAPIYACNLGKEFNFVNLAYRDRLIFFWEGWECFAITGEDTWQPSHESWNGFCRVVSKFTL